MSERYEIFIGFIEKHQDDINNGQDVEVTVKDLETFEKVGVRGKISKSGADLTDCVTVRVVTDMGEKADQMYMQVSEELAHIPVAD